jgi:hypothetical protein
VFLAAALVSLYAGLSDEGLTYLYLAMAASAVTVLLVAIQLRQGRPEPRLAPETPPAPNREVVVAGSTYHLPGCPRAADETAPERMGREAARARGLAACPECSPG